MTMSSKEKKQAIGGGAGLVKVLTLGWSHAQAGINEARRIKAQNKARIKQMQDQFDLNTQNLHNNNVDIKQNRMKNDMLIEESKLNSQDAFTQAFIGSGVSGRTQDVMAATLQSSVDKAHNEAKGIATKESDRQFLGLMRTSDQISAQIKDMDSFDFDAMESNMNMAMFSAALDEGANAAKAGV